MNIKLRESFDLGKVLRVRRLGLVAATSSLLLILAFVFVPYAYFESTHATDNGEVVIRLGLDEIALRLTVDGGTVTTDNTADVIFDEVSTTTDVSYLFARKDVTVDTNASWFALYLSSTDNKNKLCNISVDDCDMSAIVPMASKTTAASDVVYHTSWGDAVKFGRVSEYDTSAQGEGIVGAQWGYAVTSYNSNAQEAEAIFTVGNSKNQTVFSAPEYYYMGDAYEGTFSKSDYVRLLDASGGGIYRADATWLGMPGRANPHKIWSDTTIGGSKEYPKGFASPELVAGAVVCTDSSDTSCDSKGPAKFSVYYGAAVNSDLMMGTYTHNVMYTLICSLTDMSGGAVNKAYLPTTNGTGDDIIDILINLTTNAEFVSNDMKIYMIDRTDFEDIFTSNAGKWELKSGITFNTLNTELEKIGVTCTFEKATNSAFDSYENVGSNLKVHVPNVNTALGSDNDGKVVEIVDSSDDHDVSYDFVVTIPTYNLVYSTHTEGTDMVGFRYYGLQSKWGGEPIVKYMQDVNETICKNTTGWNTYEGWETGAGAKNYWTGAADSKNLRRYAVDASEKGAFRIGDAFFGVLKTGNNRNYKAVASNYGQSITSVKTMSSADQTRLGTFNGKTHTIMKEAIEHGLADNSTLYRDGGGNLVANRYAPTTDLGKDMNPDGIYYSGENYTIAEYFFWEKMNNQERWEWDLINNRSWILRDVRDGKGYVVRKYVDGNCWMAQNLDLDLQDNYIFTNNETDLNSKTKWTPSNTTKWQTNDNSRGTTIITQYETNLEYGTHNNITYAWAQDGADGAHAFDSVDSTTGTPYHYINEFTAGEPTAENGEYVTYNAATSKSDGIACQLDGEGTGNNKVTQGIRDEMSPDATVLTNQVSCVPDPGNMGNYYNWYAATAGSGTSTLTSGDAPDSICPKNWRLPTSSGEKSFAMLLGEGYGIKENADTDTIDTPLIQVLSFLRSGYYRYANGPLNNRDSYGYYWSSRATSTATNSYHLVFSSTYLNFTNSSSKSRGFALRCVVR